MVRVYIGRFKKWEFQSLITQSHLYLSQQHTDALSDLKGGRKENHATTVEYKKNANLFSYALATMGTFA